MNHQPFVHLHVHSQYSLLDSALRLNEIAETAKKLEMPAVALTDHGNMFGAVQFYKACKKAAIAPIVGCEVNVCANHRDNTKRENDHLVLLARSQEGYHNLVRLVSYGWVEGFAHGIPRIDWELLGTHARGLIALSGCMGGVIAQQVLNKGEQAGREALGKLRERLDPGALYVELQDFGFVEQKILNRILVSLARELELPLVATNDCHYLERRHARAQMVLQCISAGCTVDEMERVHHKSEEIYFKSGAEMLALFAELPDAISNTMTVAEMCGGAANPLAPVTLPRFPVPDGLDESAYFRRLAREGLELRLQQLEADGGKPDVPAYRARLEMECDVICKMAYAGYFLIVHDFVNWAKRQGIPVGPGRGSGAGSLVSYSMRITDLDPIRYGLLFERFLNPERVSMPDFDIDFCVERRDEVIRYVREKYGNESVGQIATFHLLKSRSVVRDVGRVMKMTPQEAGRIASLVPEPLQGRTIPIAQAIEQERRLQEQYRDNPQIKELLDTAMSLENLNRHAGMHAAGVVISQGPLWDRVPVFCPEPGVFVTQYSKDDVEAAGLVKFDFLGLKTLTVIDIAKRLINRRPDRNANPLIIERIALDDKATYALLQSGETTNVFQLESSGMQNLMKQLKPDCFEDILALVALYRPGPLGSDMVDKFVAGKRGRGEVRYPHPCLKETLKETFGVMVYQEQVMQAAREMAGFSLGGADLLRRAMGKKKPEEMAKQKVAFVTGALEKGHTSEEATGIFDLIEKFADYGFNKSHSAAYALIAYQCAYLKTHFPVEFICSTLTADKDKIDKVVRTVAEARSMGITVLPPDVNESEIDFTVVYNPSDKASAKPRKDRPVASGGAVRDPMGPAMRFGLGAVKGVGAAALEAIFEAREGTASSKTNGKAPRTNDKKQPFIDLFDFTSRVDLRRVNKAVLEALIQCGAMDGIHQAVGVRRDQAFAAIDLAIEQGKKISAERESGQTSLFAMLDMPASGSGRRTSASGRRSTFGQTEPWERNELLKREKSALGFCISGHPVDDYRAELERFCNANTATVSALQENAKASMGGVIEDYRERNTKAGDKIAFFWLEDPVGRTEVVVRSKQIEAFREALHSDLPVMITGIVKFDRERQGGPSGDEHSSGEVSAEAKLLLDEVAPLAEALRARTKSVAIQLHLDQLDREKLVALREVLTKHPGRCPVILEMTSSDQWSVTLEARGLTVDPTEVMLSKLEHLFGKKVCELR